MLAISRTRSRKLGTLLILSIIFLLVTSRITITNKFAIVGSLSQSLDLITDCTVVPAETSNHSMRRVDPRIPRLVHQIWETAEVQTYSTNVEASRASWETMFEPLNYSVKLWSDDAILDLIESKYFWLLSTYQGYKLNIQRADLARLVIVHAEGGIYADLDVYPNSPAHISCLQHLGLQGIFASTSGLSGLSNHFFMAEQGSLFLQWTLYEAKRRGAVASKCIMLPYLRVFWSTGPLMVTATFRKYAWLYSTMRKDIGMVSEGYGLAVFQHKAGRSWHGWDGRVLNYIADHVQTDTLVATAKFAGILGAVFAISGIIWWHYNTRIKLLVFSPDKRLVWRSPVNDYYD